MVPWKEIIESPSGSELSAALGRPLSLWLLWATGVVESNLRNVNKPAKGVWQFLPSTIKLYGANRPLPPWSDADLLVQGQYAAAHLLDNVKQARTTVPPTVARFIVERPEFKPHAFLLSVRAFYHGGPAIAKPNFPDPAKPAQIALEAELRKGLTNFVKCFGNT